MRTIVAPALIFGNSAWYLWKDGAMSGSILTPSTTTEGETVAVTMFNSGLLAGRIESVVTAPLLFSALKLNTIVLDCDFVYISSKCRSVEHVSAGIISFAI